MVRRHATICVLTLSAALAALPSVTFADPTPPVAATGDAKPYVAQVGGDDVLVRSGPSEGFYATQKLNKGDRVTVVGIRGANGDWLKIVPPDGSFCYVAQAYVDRSGGTETTGRVKKPDLNVRAGSLLNGSKKTRLMTLNTDDTVQIVGVQDDYFKIAPPPGAYLYVQRSLVTPVPDAPAAAVPLVARANDREPMSSDPIPTVKPPVVVETPPAVSTAAPVVLPPLPPQAAPVPTPAAPPAATPAVTASTPAAMPPLPMVPATPSISAPPADPQSVAVAPVAPPMPMTPSDDAANASARIAAPATTRPSAVAMARPGSVSPTTRPVDVSPRQRFDLTEAEFLRTSKLPPDRQPLDGLSWRYKTLANNAALPASLRQVARNRMAALAVRIDARRQLNEANQSAMAAADREKALQAEQQELSQRVKEQEVSTYAAVGTLRLSSLQQSGTTLYRLTDPNTGRTLIYVRSNDPKYAGLLNQFIGVHGNVTQDAAMSLRYVTPTDAEPVDVAKVNNGVNAAFVPPSLLTKGSAPSGT